MPRYDYECDKCGPFEAVQSMRDPPLEFHDCGGKAVRKIAAVSFALKGGGWYADGYTSGASGGSKSEACSPEGCAKPGCAAKVAEA